MLFQHCRFPQDIVGYKIYLHIGMTLKSQRKTDLIHVSDANANVDVTYSTL